MTTMLDPDRELVELTDRVVLFTDDGRVALVSEENDFNDSASGLDSSVQVCTGADCKVVAMSRGAQPPELFLAGNPSH